MKGSGQSELIGLILLGLSLSFNGYESVCQDNLRKNYEISGSLIMFILNF